LQLGRLHQVSSLLFSQSEKAEKEKNLVSHSFFNYVSPLIQLGSQKELSEEDLEGYYDINELNLDEGVRVFDTSLKNERSKFPIFRAMVTTYGKEYALCGLRRLCSDIGMVSGPFIMQYILATAEAHQTMSYSTYMIWTLVLCLVYYLSTFIQTIFWQNFMYHIHGFERRLHYCLAMVIYKKSLLMSNEAKQDMTTGEVINLLAVDADRIGSLFYSLHVIWASLFKISVAFYLISTSIGFLPALSGITVVFALVIPINAAAQHKFEHYSTMVDDLSDERSKLVSQLVSSIRLIKVFAWEKLFADKIEQVWKQERGAQQYRAAYSTVIGFIWHTCTFMISCASFMFYIWLNESDVTLAQTFGVMFATGMLTYPLYAIPEAIVRIIQARASSERIQKYLDREDLQREKESNSMYVVDMENATFAWKNNDPILNNISLQVTRGEFIAVVGKVGSAKTSLLSAILGEMRLTSGVCEVDRLNPIAYASQDCWILSDTVRNNILFGSPMDKQRYNQVLQACALGEDMKSFSSGDLTLIGERGVTLSGGQKARISLARTVYHNSSDLVLLDDPLSAVDIHTGRHIMDNVILGELRNKTRILVTHHLDMLHHADRIIVLEEGHIQNIYTYPELMQSEFADKMKRKQVEMETIDGTDDCSTVTEQETNEAEKMVNEQLLPEDLIGQNKYTVWFRYLATYSVLLIVAFSIIELLQGGTSTLSEYFLASWSTETSGSFTYSVTLYVSFGVLSALFRFIANAIGEYFSVQTTTIYHDKLLQAIIHAPVRFYDSTASGKIVARFSKDLGRMIEFGWQSRELIMSVLKLAISAFVIFNMALQSSFYNALALLVVVVPMLYVYKRFSDYYNCSQGALTKMESKASAPVFSHFSETLAGLSVIRAFDAKNRFTKLYGTKLEKMYINDITRFLTQLWFDLRIECLGNAITFAVMLISVWILPLVTVNASKAENTATMALFALTISQITSLQLLINWLTVILATLQMYVTGTERIEQYSAVKSEKYEPITKNEMPIIDKGPTIAFENVRMRYDNTSQRYVLNNINIVVQSAKKVAIVGRTGSGKSSLINALFRLNEIESGSITINGVDTGTLPLKELRSSMAIIPQDPILIQGTLRENLDPENQFSDRTIWQALDHVSLREKVDNLNMEIAENGANLSTGERQLISLCRAWLKQRKVLVLDEATANVDHATDSLIQKTIRQEFEHCTVICIAHRLETIMDYDVCIVMSEGQVIQMGNPETMLRSGRGPFYELVNRNKH
jgi:ABC-type multidrug transport system fused ATPase/permease subunit